MEHIRQLASPYVDAYDAAHCSCMKEQEHALLAHGWRQTTQRSVCWVADASRADTAAAAAYAASTGELVPAASLLGITAELFVRTDPSIFAGS